MSKNVQIVKMDKSILQYFRMTANLDNQGEQYSEDTEKEFIEELTKSLNSSSVATKKIVWV